MKTIARWVLVGCFALAGGLANAAVTCTVNAASATATVTNVFTGGNVDVSGSVDFNCTRVGGDPKFVGTYWVGSSLTNGASRVMTTFSPSLTYQLFTDYTGCATAWSPTSAGLTVANPLVGGGDRDTCTLTVTFCMRIPTGQLTARAGTYLKTETVTIRDTNSAGTSRGTGTLSLSATVSPLCVFASGTTLAFNYTSFQAQTAQGAGGWTRGNFTVQCTNQTPFSLALDAVSGSVGGLSYSLGLSTSSGATSGSQTINSQTGVGSTATTYYVPGDMAASQSGTCASGGTCPLSDTRTVTITY